MNNDSTPIDLPRTEASASTSAHIADHTLNTGANSATNATAEGSADGNGSVVAVTETPAQERAKLRVRKRTDFLSDLVGKLDTLIYMEFCVLYYLDCSLFRFLVRLVPQWIFLTPKPPPVPQQKPSIPILVVSSLVCIFLHIFTQPTEAGEAMRYYLHGGIIPDFVGQKSPSSKITLIMLDLLVLALQGVMLTVHVEKERLKGVMKGIGTRSAGQMGQEGGEAMPGQDHDAEERGVLRDDDNTALMGHEIEDIELRPLRSTTTHADEEEDYRNEPSSERAQLLSQPSSSRTSIHPIISATHDPESSISYPDPSVEHEHAADIFYSGNLILGEFHILDAIRSEWEGYGSATEGAIQSVGFGAGFAAVAANRRFGARIQRGMEMMSG